MSRDPTDAYWARRRRQERSLRAWGLTLLAFPVAVAALIAAVLLLDVFRRL